MKKHFVTSPTFKNFSRFNDYYRLKGKRKPRNPKWLKIIYYPFSVIALGLFHFLMFIFLCMLLGAAADARRNSYRTSGKYRKVIKEGILWDSVEYHER